MNYEESRLKLERFLLARIPFIQVVSFEKERVNELIKLVSDKLNMTVYYHNMSTGIINITTGEVISDQKLIMGALDFIANQIKTARNLTFVLNDVAEFNEDSLTSRYLSNIINEAEKNSCSIILISDDPSWIKLQRQGVMVELALPNQDEIEAVVKKTIEPYISRIQNEWTESDIKEVSNILKGLSQKEIKNVLLSIVVSGSLTKQDIVELRYTKDDLFSNIGGIEKIKVDENLSYGGLENLKEWLLTKEKLLSSNQKTLLEERGMRTPRGILLMGVPGCGKSLSAKAVSQIWKLPLYLLDFATIQGMYVGQSEQQLKEALEAAEHVAPCVLWIDEIEKGLSAGNDSSGVTQRLIGQFLFWLQECKKDVFVIATANDVSKLNPELLRKGRFDELFFIDLPNKAERKVIISLYLKKYLKMDFVEDVVNRLVELSENFTGADLESVIRDYAYNTIANQKEVSHDEIYNLFSKTVSLYDTNKEKVEELRSWAKERTVNASKQDIIQNSTPIETLTLES